MATKIKLNRAAPPTAAGTETVAVSRSPSRSPSPSVSPVKPTKLRVKTPSPAMSPPPSPADSSSEISPPKPTRLKKAAPKGSPPAAPAPKGKSKTPTPGTAKASEFQELSDIEHAFLKNGMYIGDDNFLEETEDWFYNFEHNWITKKQRTLPPAVERLFLEILSNAGDNADRSRKNKMDPVGIWVTMDSKTITVRNGGRPFPIEIHPETKVYVPEMILGHMRTGSNYDPSQQTGVGTNGLGAKLVNIYSHRFSVQVLDPYNQKAYMQEWTNGMHECNPPMIQDIKAKPKDAFVEISYDLNFERFRMTEYPDEAFELFARSCADVSFTCKVPVFFNGRDMSSASFEAYTQLYHQVPRQKIFHYEWKEGVETILKKKTGQLLAKDPNEIPTVQICLMDSPHDAEVISFVNGLMTRDGGVHVDAVYNAVKKEILDMAQGLVNKPSSGGKSKKSKSMKDLKGRVNKGKQKESKKLPKATKAPKEKKNENISKLTVRDLKPHLTLFISFYHVKSPGYNSQNKNICTSVGSDPKTGKKIPIVLTIPSDFYKPMASWELLTILYMSVNKKDYDKARGLDGKKSKYIGIEKVTDANFAAGEHSEETTLFYTEGNSAASLPIKIRSEVPNGNDYFGVYPGRGKISNVSKLNEKEIRKIFIEGADLEPDKQHELVKFMKTVGLTLGMDYSSDEKFKTLRYGRIIILADADDDGKHITGLLMLFFHCLFPSLLARGFVFILRTPLLRLKYKNERYKFYSVDEWNRWIAASGVDITKLPKPDYFKGLGTSTDKQIIEDINDGLRYVSCLYDTPDANEEFDLVFGKERSNDRKNWIAECQSQDVIELLGGPIEDVTQLPISYYVHYEVLEFSKADVRRSVNRLLDGFKPSQRKLLFTLLGKIGSKTKYPKFKVENFASLTVDATQYHHGPRSLIEAIVCMTQSFVGTNNMEYFKPKAQFGTRYKGGEDNADARYSYIKGAWWLPLIYRKEDREILTIRLEDNEPAEPESFLPIIPMGLVNGSFGIGTGWSTFIPNHNPLDLIAWIRAMIRGEELPMVNPWYRGFKGTIEVKKRIPKALLTQVQAEQVEKKREEQAEKMKGQPKSRLRLKIEEDDPDEIDFETLDSDVLSANTSAIKSVMITKGHYYVKGKSVIVDELPIGRWSHDYDKWLEELARTGHLKDKRNLCKHDTVNFVLDGFENPDDKKLRLYKSYGLTNMVLLDSNGTPVRYNSVQEILHAFYQERLPYYEARRQRIIRNYRAKIDASKLKIKFIRAYLAGDIIINQRTEADIQAQMDREGLPMELLDKTNLRNLTQNKIEAFTRDIEKAEEALRLFCNKGATDLWLDDLEEFETAYCKYYKIRNPNGKPISRMNIKKPTVQSNILEEEDLPTAPTDQ